MGTAIDILIQIEDSYDGDSSVKRLVRTNAKREALEELLSAWLQDEIVRGPDGSGNFIDRRMYTIKIGYVLASDSFVTESDTGSQGLTVGIVSFVLRDFETIDVFTLKGEPVPTLATVAALEAPPPDHVLTEEEARQLEVERLENEAQLLDDAR